MRRFKLVLFALTGAIAVLALVVALTLRLRYGGGEPYPDLSEEPLFAGDVLEPVVVSEEPIGNVAVSSDHRIFYTIHPESRPTGAKLLEWRDGAGVPWPSAAAQQRFDTVLGVAIDAQERLWTIDHGNHATGTPRLLAFDIATGQLVHEHQFARDLAPLGSFLQDLKVAEDGDTVYIADVSFWRKHPAIIVYDRASGRARRVLQDHPSVSPQDWIVETPAKKMTFFAGLVALKAGVDGLVLSTAGDWLYYAAMSHSGLFRVPTAALSNPALSAVELAQRVERVGAKPLSDGLGIDAQGNVLVTDVEHGAVLRIASDGTRQTLVASSKLRWADAVTYGPEGWLYIADSAIPEQMLQSKDHIRASAPYYVWRFRPDIAGHSFE